MKWTLILSATYIVAALAIIIVLIKNYFLGFSKNKLRNGIKCHSKYGNLDGSLCVFSKK
jgi:hypothetical protein